MYLVSKLLSSTSAWYPRPIHVGGVEIKKYDSLTSEEKKSLKISMRFNLDNQELKTAMLASCIIDLEDSKEAVFAAEHNISEALDLLDISSNIIGLAFQKASGFYRDLRTGILTPCPKPFDVNFSSFAMMPFLFPSVNIAQWISGLEHSELKRALQRSLHWRRISRRSEKPEVQFLHYWLSLEAIWKVDQTTSMSPVIRWCLGFPTGASQQNINATLLANITSHPDYTNARNYITNMIDSMRELRNDIAHDGFRLSDINYVDIRIYNRILTLASSRSFELVRIALEIGLTTSKDALDEMSFLVECRPNWLNDFHNNVIFMLMNPGTMP